MTAPIEFGGRDKQGDDDAAEWGGRLERFQEVIDRRPELIDEIDDRGHIGDQHENREPCRRAGGVRLRVGGGRELEIFVIAACLEKQKQGVEAQRDDDHGDLLNGRVGRPGRRLGEVRQDQRERHERQEHAEIGVGALQIELLLAVLDPADKKRDSDHAVHDDHDDGHERVAHERRVRPAMAHDRRDRNDFDRCDGEREQQRPIGFAEPLGQVFRMAHDRKRRAEHDAEEPDEDRGENQRIGELREEGLLEQREGEDRTRRDRQEPFPPRAPPKPIRRRLRDRGGEGLLLRRHAFVSRFRPSQESPLARVRLS